MHSALLTPDAASTLQERGPIEAQSPVLVEISDPEAAVDYRLSVHLSRRGRIDYCRLESAVLWIGKQGFDVETVTDSPRDNERAGAFLLRKFQLQIRAALQAVEKVQA